MSEFDAIIIGTGQAGPALAHRLADSGMKVAIAERHLFGGTCVNTGCTPTKTLVASAYAAHMARRAADFGIVIEGGVRVDMKKVKARKDYVSGLSNKGVERSLRSNPNIAVYQGHARFLSARKVSVGSEVLEAPRIFVNVGGRAFVPDIPGLEDAGYFTNSTMLDVDFVPPHLIVIGGSYIGLEFAQIYRRFGSRVTVIELAPRLIPREDEDVSAAVADILKAEGIDIHLGVQGLHVAKRDEEVAVNLDSSVGASEVAGTHILVAVGRRPNTDDLGLAFTHTSWNDFEIVAANLFDNDPRRVSDRITAYNLYTDPPLGRVGLTEAEVRKSGKPALIATMAMEDVSRAFEKGETQGFMKVLVDRDSKQFLGASILGVGGDEMVHAILDLMYAKAPYTVMQRAVHIHPTVSELLPTMLGDLKPLE
jgi:pyruvate/2-oxoglutarate dehydrogenase complex dihydrolipoamide dehydrogenase (E3) component